VQQLAELHRSETFALMFRSLHPVH
jgi:hypothetical protein